jgi:hypothetical protein
MAKKRRDLLAAAAAFAASPQGRRLIQQVKEYAQRPETRQKALQLLEQARSKRKGTPPPSYGTPPKR